MPELAPGDANNALDGFVRDLRKGETRLVSRGRHGALGNGSAIAWGIAAHGKPVLYTSEASNLVRGDTTASDVFVTGSWRS